MPTTEPEPDELADQAEDLAARPAGGTWQMGVFGIGAAAVLVAVGIWGMANEKAFLPLTDGVSTIYGESAFYYSIGYLSIGLFLHFHYFWGHTSVPFLSEVGKVLSCVGAFVGFSWGFILRLLP